MSFKDWYNSDGSTKSKKIGRAEKLFEETVGHPVNSLDAFISYLILHKKISGSVKMKHRSKPVALMSLSEEKKICHLVKCLRSIEEDIQEYNKIWHA